MKEFNMRINSLYRNNYSLQDLNWCVEGFINFSKREKPDIVHTHTPKARTF